MKSENELCYEHAVKLVETSYEHQKCKLTEPSLTINRKKESKMMKKDHVCPYSLQF
jgi:hypothetical protein